ncbi:MAG TPA: oligosaccharide flippase family protein [Dehalococcoidia bacterium]|nr:oligosaccharide flippase family protein [Dehalococcoidia bacterium]
MSNAQARVARNTLLQLAGRLMTSLLSLAAVSILARSLGAEEVGSYLLVLSLLAMLNLSDLGFSTIGIRELAARPDEQEKLLGEFIVIRIGLALLAMVIVSIAALLLDFGSAVTTAIWLGSLTYLFTALGPATFGLTFAANLRMEYQVAANVIQAGVLVGLVAMLGLLGGGIVAAVLAYDASVFVGSIMTVILASRFVLPRLSLDIRRHWWLLRESAPMGLAALCWLTYNRIDMVLISKLADEEALGLYSVAYKSVDLAWPIGLSFALSAFPLLTRHFRAGDTAEFQRLLQKSFDMLSVLMIPAVTFLIVFAEQILVLVGSDDFRPAATSLRLLALAIGVMLVSVLMSHALMAAGRQSGFFRAMPIWVCINIGLNLFLIPWLGFNGAAIATLLTELSILLCVLVLLARHVHHVPSFAVPARMMAVALATVAALLALPDDPAFRIVFLPFAFIVGTALTRAVAIADLREIVRRERVAGDRPGLDARSRPPVWPMRAPGEENGRLPGRLGNAANGAAINGSETTKPSDPSDRALEGRDIVCLSFSAWDDHWGTPQQLISRLGKRNRILYVEPPVSPMSFFTGLRRKSFVWQRLRYSRVGPRHVDAGIWVAAPPMALPLRYTRPVSRANALIMRRWLAKQVEELGLRDVILWNFQPLMAGVAGAVNPALTIYHCVDDFTSVPKWWNRARDVQAREMECCLEADLVVCTGRELTNSRRVWNPRTHFVPNGADVELFAKASSPEIPVDPALSGIPGKVLLFLGVMDFRLDVDLLEYVARRAPHWSLVMVGLVKGDVDLSRLTSLPNVHLVDWQPPERLPGFLKSSDVCLIPYVTSQHTNHVFPLKLFEYLAAGKPVVATALKELAFFEGDLVRLADSPEAFFEAIEIALEADSPQLADCRRLVARHNSWEHRIQALSELIPAASRQSADGPSPAFNGVRAR